MADRSGWQRVHRITKNVTARYIALFFVLLMPTLFTIRLYNHQMLFRLGHSFASGFLWVDQFVAPVVPYGDLSFFANHFYVLWGPLPSVFYLPLLPLSYFLNGINLQTYSVLILNVINLWLLYRIVKQVTSSDSVARWLTIAFGIGSCYFGVAAFTLNSYVTHVFTVLWLFAAIDEYLNHRRYLLIGLLMAFAYATRVTAGIGIIFFILTILGDWYYSSHRKKVIPQTLRSLAQLLLPFATIVLWVLLYNYARFQNFFEAGYSYSLLNGELLQARLQGLFAIEHVRKNLSLLLFGLPQIVHGGDGHITWPFFKVNGWGMSIFFTSPYLVSLFPIRRLDWFIARILITCACVLIPLLFLFSTGTYQYGYRFTLDFLPFIWLLWAYAIAKRYVPFGRVVKTAIVVAAAINYVLVLSLFFPVF